MQQRCQGTLVGTISNLVNHPIPAKLDPVKNSPSASSSDLVSNGVCPEPVEGLTRPFFCVIIPPTRLVGVGCAEWIPSSPLSAQKILAAPETARFPTPAKPFFIKSPLNPLCLCAGNTIASYRILIIFRRSFKNDKNSESARLTDTQLVDCVAKTTLL